MTKYEIEFLYIQQLGSDNESERKEAQEVLLAMGDEVLEVLDQATREPSRYPEVEVYRMISMIGETCGDRWKAYVQSAMKLAAQNGRTTESAEVVRQIGCETLEKWGLEVPEPLELAVQHCVKCKRPNTEVYMHQCFLPSCRKPICDADGIKVESRFGTWFCCEDHKKRAMNDPSLMM